jgi:hypothetical protein
MSNRIEDLEDIIKVLVDMLNNFVPKEEIKLQLRKYHYCFDCMNHYRGCRCDESNESESSEVDDNYTSSEASNES